MRDWLYRMLGISRDRPSQLEDAERTIAKVDGIVRDHRDKVAEEFRRTERAMKGRYRVP